jgi:hypothetical protein
VKLLQVDPLDSSLFLQFPLSRVDQPLVFIDESSGECPPADERLCPALDKEYPRRLW